MKNSKEKTNRKKKYTAPKIEFEFYKLDMNIAGNCKTVVSNGPAAVNHPQCEDYTEEDPFDGLSGYSLKKPYNVMFYEDTNCECTYTSDQGYWTS